MICYACHVHTHMCVRAYVCIHMNTDIDEYDYAVCEPDDWMLRLPRMCVCVCVCVYMYMYRWIQIYTCITYMYIYMFVCVYVCVV